MNDKPATTEQKLRYKKYRVRAFVMIVLAVLAAMFCFNQKQGDEIGSLESHLAALGDSLAMADSSLSEARGLATSQQRVIEELEDTLYQTRQVVVEQVDSIKGLNETLARTLREAEDTVTKLVEVITELPKVVYPERRPFRVAVDDPRFEGEITVEAGGDPEAPEYEPDVDLQNLALKPVSLIPEVKCLSINQPTVDLNSPDWMPLAVEQGMVTPDVCQPPHVGHVWYKPQVSDGVLIGTAATVAAFVTFWWWEAR